MKAIKKLAKLTGKLLKPFGLVYSLFGKKKQKSITKYYEREWFENPRPRLDTVSHKARKLRLHVFSISTPKKVAIGAVAAGLVAAVIFSLPLFFVAKPTLSAINNNSQFSANADPLFKLDSSGLVKTKTKKSSKGKMVSDKASITAKVTRNINIDHNYIEPQITSDGSNTDSFEVRVPKTDRFKPGLYKLEVIIDTGKVKQTLTQDFKWGVLAINPDKGIYSSGDEALIALGILDDSGHMICDAAASLQVVDPAGIVTVMSTDNGKIKISETCKDYSNQNPHPDYFGYYKTDLPGNYVMRLHVETKNGPRDMEDGFIVKNNEPFEVTRDAPTRIFPTGPISSKIVVKANTSFTGKIQEIVPASFKLFAGDFTVKNSDTKKILTWDAQLEQGETKTFEYNYDPPRISPEFYTTGPVSIVSTGTSRKTLYQEPRKWEIASDASCTLTVSSGVNWTTAAWASCNSSYPGATAAGDTATVTSGGAFTLTVNQTIPYSLASLAVVSNANAATITFGGAYTMNVTTSPGTVTIPQKTTTSGTNAINVNTGTLNTTGDVSFSGTNTAFGYVATLVVTTGLLDVGGQVSFANVSSFLASNAIVSLNNTGTIRIRSAETQYCGTIRNQTTAGTIQFDSSWTYSAGTGCVAAFSNIANSVTKLGGNFTIGSLAGSQIVMNATSTTEITNSLTMTNNNSASISNLGNVTIMSGATLTLGSNYWWIMGNWTNNSAASGTAGLTPNTYAVHFRSTGKTIGGTAQTSFYDLIIGAAAQITANTSFTVTNNLTFAVADGANANTLTLGSSGITATVAAVTHSQPTLAYTSAFNVNAGTLTMSGTYTFLETTTTTTRVSSLVLTTGTINLNGATSISGGTTPACHTINLSGGAGTLNIAGSIANSSGNTINPGTTSTVNFNGSSAQTIPMGTSGGTRWGACTTRCYGNLKIMNTNSTTGASLGNVVASGNISGNVTVGDDSVAAVFTDPVATFVGAGTATLLVNNNATFNMTSSAAYPTGFGTFTYDANSTVNYMQTSTPLTVTNATYGNLGLMAAGTATQNFPAATTNIEGSLTIGDGTNATTAVANASYTIYVAGNWTLAANSSFNHSNGTVIMDGAGGSTQAISGDTTFYILQMPNAGTARTVTFANSSTTTVANSWTAAGAAGQLITLRSANNSTPNWNINPASATISYAQVNYSNAGGAAAPICATYSPNGTGNDADWRFSSGSTCVAPPALVMFYQGTTPPAGWSIVSDTGGAFENRFIRGNSTQGGTGGNSTHTHSSPGTLTTSTYSNSSGMCMVGTQGIWPEQTTSHSHTTSINGGLSGTNLNIPEYRDLTVIQYDAGGVPTTLPDNVIGIFDSAPPTGWDTATLGDGRYIKGGKVADYTTTGGSNTHQHALTMNNTSSTSPGLDDSEGSAKPAGHYHTVSYNTPGVDIQPPHINVILAKRTNTASTSIPVGMIGMWYGDNNVPSGWTSRSANGQPFYQNFFKPQSSYSSTVTGSATHSHSSLSATTSNAVGTFGGSFGSDATCYVSNHTHTIGFSLDSQNNLPSYLDVIIMQKDVPPITIAGTVYQDTTGENTLDTTAYTISASVNNASPNSCTRPTTSTYSCANVTAAAGAKIMVYINGNANNANTATISGGSDISGLDLIVNRLMVGNDNSGSTTNADIMTFSTNPAAGDSLFSGTSPNLVVANTAELHVISTKTYAPGGTVTTSAGGAKGNIHIVGTMSVGTNAVSVGGNFTNDGTFSKSGTQTTTFTATATGKTIKTNTSHFHHLTFNGSGGNWAFQDTMNIDGDLTITATAGSGNGVDWNDVTVNVSGSVTGSGGRMAGGNSTINVGVNFDISLVYFTPETSTINLTGTGNFKQDTVCVWGAELHNVNMAASGQTTTMTSCISADGVVTLGTGTLAGNTDLSMTGNGTPLVNNGATISNTGNIVFYTARR